MRILKAIILSLLIISGISPTLAQSVDEKLINWYNKDLSTDQVYGISTERAYNEILKKKQSKTVIVAILDSGVDIEHEDLKGKIWVNEDEIAGNGIDDDGNGYIDDIHGWNFLGNPNGENVEHETLEITRLYRKYKKQFDGKNASEIAPGDMAAYNEYKKIKPIFEEKFKQAREEYMSLKSFGENYQLADRVLREQIGKEDYSIDDVRAIESNDATVLAAQAFMLNLMQNGFTKKEFETYKEYIDAQYNYHYNVKYNPRTIIGDDPEDMRDSNYGNNDVEGAHADHGTHVAGIVAAVRGNNLGMDGIANDVKIMAVRVVPDGDERDKDVANAIRYAVDNGAQIINMSFGKSYSPNKDVVDEAIRYAESKGVLLIHGAGNDASNVDVTDNFPTNYYSNASQPASNWITVGATSKEDNEKFVAVFSNYGRKKVDVFAPGVDIYSLKPESEYEVNSGTSMASPIVAGLAALLKSYYPQLSAEQIKNIILESSDKPKFKVYMPTEGGKAKKTKFKKLSVTGGVVNAYKAVLMAEELTAGISSNDEVDAVNKKQENINKVKSTESEQLEETK